MRQSTLFGRTLREAPTDAQTPGHQLMLRAALARQTAAGLYTLLPLGKRAAMKIERIVREEMDRIGCQEMEMPVITPSELWKETGRWDLMDAILFKFRDHNEHEYLVSYTHEEVVTHHGRSEILSYRQLPISVYHFQPKGRDEARPRAGLLRAREFVMKDAYTFDADWEGLDRSYEAQHGAYARAFARMGLDAVSVESDAGLMGGDIAHEFQVFTDVGEDRILVCGKCDHMANMEMATRRVTPAKPQDGAAPRSEIATPGVTTIEALEKSLGRPASAFLKTVLVKGKDEVVAVVLPGDREANEPKLRKLLGVGDVRFADDADLKKAGGVAGFVGPVGLRARVVMDTSVEPRAYVSGANKKDTHFDNVVPGRDFSGEVADVHDVKEGDACPKCGSQVSLRRGVEVGNIFKLGTYYSSKMGATYLAADGTRKPFIMGSYGIGIGRCLQTIVETRRDEKGIVWPMSVAPFETHVVALPMTDPAVKAAAEELVAALEGEAVEVLFDDREESAGVKFADADLIGSPLRVTVSKRNLAEDKVELRWRKDGATDFVPRASAAPAIAALVRRARGETVA
ncbi:MAG TPA: proline--tRNA ligase [Candidatus Limnocylindria bacterium]|nr:proline--tRNA ligase [Candidatus Limnocylindria bacterium]